MKIWVVSFVVTEPEAFGAYQTEEEARIALDEMVDDNPNLEAWVSETELDLEACLVWDEDNDVEAVYGNYADAIEEYPDSDISVRHVR